MAIEIAHQTRRRFTREEYHRMAEVGILRPKDRVELIRGEIVEMSPIGKRHKVDVDSLTMFLASRLVDRAIVRVQSSIVLGDDTEPEPDLVLLRPRPNYREVDATAEDVLLLIEVAESSLPYDRTTKLRLYAESGIAEYWIVDSVARAVEVHRTPRGGAYEDVRRLTGDATVSPLAFPDVALPLAKIFA
jgi:Uma2 family endonuclease